MPEVDQMIFTIPNAELWAGREEIHVPTGKVGAAESFRIAPGGTFWIADTAVFPNRLLQYNAQGELLQEISLGDWVVYAHALSIDQNRVWILDISVEQPRLVQLSLSGNFLSNVDIPKEIMTQGGMLIGNGAFDLILGDEGALLLNTINGYYEMVDSSGEFVFQPLNQLSHNGYTFQAGHHDEATGKLRDGSLACDIREIFVG